MNNIDSIAFLPAVAMPTLQAIADPELQASPATALNGDFAEMMSAGLKTLNDKMVSTDVALQRLSTGAETNLHGVMMQLEDAKLSLQLALQVRNRLLDAYSELARMQI